MESTNKTIVSNFISEIWNNNQLEKIDTYLHPNFKDHSLPTFLAPDKEGTKSWILATSSSFEHQTGIEEIVAEDDKVMVKIKMRLKHTGVWRGIEPTQLKISTPGYRYFKLSEGKIIEHWALVDGTVIENKLQQKNHGCKI